MKTFRLTVGILVVMLSGCMKDHGSVETIKNSIVTFKIGGLSHEVGQTNTGFQTEPMAAFIRQLTVIAYNTQTGAEVTRKTQLATSAAFGQVSFELPNGTYNFVAVGSQGEFGINQFYEGDKDKPVFLPYAEANFQYWQPSWSFQDKYYKTSDTFFAKMVGTAINKNQMVEIIMERIVGLLNVIVTDLPVYSIDLTSEYSGFKFDTAVPYSTIENDFASGWKQSKNGPISYYILKNQTPVRVHIGAGGERSIAVTVPKNKRTTVSIQSATMAFTTVTE
ncbi:FimB/Mfa2 family fimbrial subunit [Pedobacter sp. HDW13]|uniref:FimB/Mfa2 family fimbrial subunit n=1 Tax=unclassified Pedobacter TaxID=2628915 RepID=UPI000F59D4A9|nr:MULTISPECIES: FimB/Mfa2 family fimbrial subunit [unclassified Pedobacter]QIL41661.1 FimB/Mfa2 family fimbrial subunit [Pedobacter sp. HDW13]